MPKKINVQLHFWPWLVGIMEETVNLITGEAIFPFYGSPVISISAQASLFLPQRHEKFTPFGSQFETLGGIYGLYEMPHGVIATRHSVTTEATGKISVHTHPFP